MAVDRRFGPLIAAVCLGILILVVRLYQVQIIEHEIWAREATNLVRRATMEPYLRGAITDRHGEVMVKDVEACSIQFVYRDFRRKHPLGQVTHARSALEHRSVPLEDAVANMEAWAFALLESSPAELDRFEDGEAVTLAGFELPHVGKKRRQRRSRAGDLRFYIHGLLDVEKYEWSRIKKRLKQKRARQLSWLELAADVQEVSVEAKRASLARRFDTSLGRLEQLASELQVSGAEGELAASTVQSFWFLIDALERKRESVEGAIACDLFRAAAGFHPGRVEPKLLLTCFEFDLMSEILGWDRPRLERWAFETRRVWLENWRSFHVPAALIRADLDRKRGAQPLDALIGELSRLFAPRPRTERERRAQSRAWHEWRERDEVVVFSELDDLFADDAFESPADGEVSVPFIDGELRRANLEQGIPAALIPVQFADEVAYNRPLTVQEDWRGDAIEPWVAPRDLAQATQRLLDLFAWRSRDQASASDFAPRIRPAHLDEQELLPWIAELWQAQFQARLRERLVPSEHEPDATSGEPSANLATWPKPFAGWRYKAARQAAGYAIRDRSSRPELLHDDPDEAVVNLLIRFQADYGGFSILPRTKRLAMAFDEDQVFVAGNLIGEVRESTLEEVIEQQPERSSLSKIMRKRVRTAADSDQVKSLVEATYRNDEMHGSSGIEGLCDSVLRGRNGFTEHIGLQEREEAAGAALGVQKTDGKPVQLTLDLELQKAAQYVIEHPVMPTGEEWRDEVWVRNPVGAIVLATVEGEILAAASGPKQEHEPIEHRDAERRFTYDRCFRRRQFQPIGSIFKPFVAAYALDRLGLTEDTVLACEYREDVQRAGWGKVSCNSKWGHKEVTLERALERSCNAYFAQVGELYQDGQTFIEMARMFGFDRPTGVTDAWDGRGFGEDSSIRRFADQREFTLTELHRGGNGLEVLEASPVQVARAVAGLATGRLPAMRLVRAIDGVPVPASFDELPLSQHSLGLVRTAMRAVITKGTAADRGLESRLLGFDLAGKTGSADYRPMSNAYRAQLRTPQGRSPEMRKHTWFMGYFPADDPQVVVVVYLHDIGVTAGHSAVYVAGQFLKTPAVQRYAKQVLR